MADDVEGPFGEQVAAHPKHHHALDKDTRMLHALGYAQELRRSMSGFSNFAISFTIISILSGTLTLYGTGINYGGPIDGGVRLAARLGVRHHRRPRHGRDRVEVPDRGRPLLLGVEDGQPGLGLVHRLVQPDRPDRDHRRHRLRRRDLHRRAAAAALAERVPRHSARDRRRLRRDPVPARRDEHLQRQARRDAERRVGLVARARRRLHRDRASDRRAGPPPVVLDRVLAHAQQQRLLAQLAVVRAAPRPAAGAVHVHGLRRLGAHERGDDRTHRDRPRAASSCRSSSRPSSATSSRSASRSRSRTSTRRPAPAASPSSRSSSTRSGTTLGRRSCSSSASARSSTAACRRSRRRRA